MLTCRSSRPGSTSSGFFSVDVKPPHPLPFKLLNVPGRSFQTRAFTRPLYASGIACVLICVQSFSQGSQQTQSATSGPPGTVTWSSKPPRERHRYLQALDMASVSAQSQAASAQSAPLQRGIVKMVGKLCQLNVWAHCVYVDWDTAN